MTGKVKKSKPLRNKPDELSLQSYQLLANFRFLLARFLMFSEQAAKTEGLEPRQHQALLAIKGYPDGAPVTVGDLAERLCIRHHSAVGLVDRLVTNGYLARRIDPHDKRRAVISLTVAGEEALAALSTVHRQELRRITPLLKVVLAQLGDDD